MEPNLPDSLVDRRPDATLDLHGMTAAEAERAVRAFLELWTRRKPGAMVHLITGQGRGSAGRPVLRPRVRRLLREDLSPLVVDWASDLDEGGFLVRVRRP
jgi:DNA-nicking Smr family endonuclease